MHKVLLISSRSFTSLLLVLSALLPVTLFAQNNQPVASWLESFRGKTDFTPVQLLQLDLERSDLEATVANATVLSLNDHACDELLHVSPAALTFQIPTRDGAMLVLELVKVDILASDFTVGTKGMAAQENFPYHPSSHYRGIVRGNANSLAALSVTSSGLSAMIADEQGTRQLGLLEDGSNRYVLYHTNDLKASSPNHCFTDDDLQINDNQTVISTEDRGVGCKTVNIYFECDYKLYTDKGSSVTNVTNYVTSLFNQVATLYANENVGVAISQIYVWTSSDPYVSQNNTGNMLNAFRQAKGTTFNGNLAHLLTTRSLGGGIAYVDVICFKQYAFGVSCINTSFQNVPTYSWSVEVLTHELGHNLGSWHTQSCNWSNGAIDNCVNPEGSCGPGPAPVNGGTIMSYCHLTSHGINFNHGFGPQPGAKIREKVLAATCLTGSGSVPGSLSASNITGVSATLNWGAVAGATTYSVQYKTVNATVWTNAGNTTATSLNISGLLNNTTYQWQVKTDCSSFSPTATFTTSTGGGQSCAAPSNLLATNITTLSANLTWTQVSGASSYTVQYKTSSASIWQTAGTTGNTFYNLSGLTAGTTYNWKVKANCSNYSAATSFVTSNSGGGGGGNSCNAPATLTNNQIGSTSASISWSAVPGATSYTLQLKHANSTVYFTLGTIAVTAVTLNGLQPNTAYHWRVKANCSFYSNSRLLTTLANLQSDGGSALGDVPSMTVTATPAFGVFPNPASDRIFVQSTIASDVPLAVELFNATGKLVIENAVYQADTGMDVSNLPTGLYLLVIRQNGKMVETKKVAITR
jgi:hypothetical protein